MSKISDIAMIYLLRRYDIPLTVSDVLPKAK